MFKSCFLLGMELCVTLRLILSSSSPHFCCFLFLTMWNRPKQPNTTQTPNVCRANMVQDEAWYQQVTRRQMWEWWVSELRFCPGPAGSSIKASLTLECTPRKINGWNLKITQLKSGKSSSKPPWFRFHVNLPGCRDCFLFFLGVDLFVIHRIMGQFPQITNIKRTFWDCNLGKLIKWTIY